jgi:hypothetical protein
MARSIGDGASYVRMQLARRLPQDDLIEGTIITGASVLHEQLKNGAATLSF